MDRKRAAALIALSAAAAVVIFLVLGIGSGSGYTVIAELDDAGQVISGNDVRIGAAKAGKITDVGLTDDGTAEIEMEIDDAYAPLPEGTKLAVRSTSLFGIANRFVALEPPPGPSKPLPDGGVITLAQTTSPVEADALLDIFNRNTRAGLQTLFQGGAAALSGQAENVNETLKWLGPTFRGSGTVFGQLAKDQPAFESLLNQAAAAASAVNSRRAELVDLISNANATTAAFGDQEVHLANAVGQLPDTLRRSNTTFAKLRGAMDDLDPFVAVAKEDTRNLAPFLRDVRVLFSRSKKAVPRAAAIVNTKGKANDLRNLLGRSPNLAKVASYALPNTIAFMNRSEKTLDLFRAYTPDIFATVTNLNQVTANYDQNGHYARTIPILGAAHYDSVLNELQPQPPSDRLNGFETGVRARCPGGAMQPAPDLTAPLLVSGCNPLLTPPGP
jgi:phospholipid/cholesterol/gamma-HCH transport system substrate-binding protein